MHPIAIVAAVLAAAIHVMFFVMESLWFGRPGVHRRFGLETPEQVAAARPMAFNQGFYNLFLAAGVALGLVLAWGGAVDAGRAIVLFACACMTGAGVVLVITSPRLARAAALQAVPPAIALIVGLLA